MKTNALILGMSVAVTVSASVLAENKITGIPGTVNAGSNQSAPAINNNKSSLVTLIPNSSNQMQQSKSMGSGSNIDYLNAEALPMPLSDQAPSSQMEIIQNKMEIPLYPAEPGISKGGVGSGKQTNERLAPKQSFTEADGDNKDDLIENQIDLITPQEYGINSIEQPYTTSRVDNLGNDTSKFFPYRATGKLFFNIGSSTSTCSASLIKRGVVVTAAHCVANFGKNQYYTNWRFVPSYKNGVAPYGEWNVKNSWVMTSYYKGTDKCVVPGVVCENDVAVIVLNPKLNTMTNKYEYAGDQTGWYGFGWNGSGFNSLNQALISQLGYPGALDNGVLMQRTDSQGFVDPNLANNTIIGSLQTEGSSGGPWIVNLGLAPTLNGKSFGSAADRQVVVGVVSWGYGGNSAVKQQGASPFTSNNIVPLVNAACKSSPGAC